MKKVKHRNKVRSFIKDIIEKAREEKTNPFFSELKDFQQLAEKIPEQEQDDYEKYFSKYFDHEMNLLRIEQKKIEMNYKEVIFRTDKQAIKFEQRISDPNVKVDMRNFYKKEYLNILKPQYIIAQVLENFNNYLEVLRITRDEFNEWFFLGRIDYLEQLLAPYISEDSKRKKKEIWIYKKYEKDLTAERKERMYKRAGLLAKK